MTPEMLTVGDVAALTQLSEYTIRAAIRDGQLAATKLRGRLRIAPDDLAGWVDSGRVLPDGALDHGPAVAPRPRAAVPAGSARDAVRRLNRAGRA